MKMTTIRITSLFLLVSIGLANIGQWTTAAPSREEPAPLLDSSAAQKYLERYGYAKKLEESNGEGGSPAALVNFRGSIIKLQKFMGLPQTGELDAETMKLMAMSRCGNKDQDPDESSSGRSKRYMKVGQKWDKNHITYTIKNTTPKVGKKKTVEAIDRAFGIWSKHAPITFTKVKINENPDMVILFAQGNHGDNTAFDGQGGFLAHAFYPGSDIGGDTHFDQDEPWVYKAASPSDGNDLFLVAVHELGHALGLAHSQESRAIMAPVYKYHNLTGFDISRDDIAGIQAIYGRKSSDKSPPPKKTTTTLPKTRTRYPTKKTTTTTRKWVRPTTRSTMKTTTTTEAPEPELCKLTEYDAVSFIRGELYVFSGKYFWRRSADTGTFTGPHPISSMWQEVDHVTAVYEDPKRDVITFFQGFMYWEYRANTLLKKSSHVRNLGLQNDEVQAALWWEDDSTTFLFHQDWIWKLHESEEDFSNYRNRRRLITESGYPKKRYNKFGGVPSDFSTAFTQNDNGLKQTYFVKGNAYYTFDNAKGRVVGPAKSFRDDWLKCEERKEIGSATDDNHLPAIIAVVAIAATILIAIIVYAMWQRKRASPANVKSSVLSPGPYRHGWQRHTDAEKTMCVTAAQQRWRLMRFNFQGQV